MSFSFGWVRDYPDFRDFNLKTPEVKQFLIEESTDGLPPAYDISHEYALHQPFNQGKIGSCHDDKTQVLTEYGWLYFEELTGEEKLATVNPETSELTYELPLRIVKLEYRGKLVTAKHQNVDFAVTPDHKMLVKNWDEKQRVLGSKFQLVPASELGWYFGLMNRVFFAGKNPSCVELAPVDGAKYKKQRVKKELPLDSWLRFLGIFVAEGTLIKPWRNGQYKIQIAATKEREKSYIKQVFSELKINALELSDRFTFCDIQIYKELCQLGYFGVRAPFKFIPPFVFNLSSDKMAIFLEGHFMGDGCQDKGGVRAHYTSSARLAEELQLLVFLSGNESGISIRQPRTSTMKDGRLVRGLYPEHRISVRERKGLSVDKKKQVSLRDYDGFVYCAEIPTHHTMVTRRNGKILISGNCTANAGVNMYMTYLKVAGLRVEPLSRLFLYKATRDLLGWNGDTGALLRTTMQALATFGVPPEKYLPYNVEKFDEEPLARLYAMAQNYQALTYYRLDPAFKEPASILNAIKTNISVNRACIFGFMVYDTIDDKTGNVNMPTRQSARLGGHAVCAVGYDDDHKVPNSTMNGAIKFMNSWGMWGDNGYGYLPYEYIFKGLAVDWWTMMSAEWLDTKQFE